MNPLLSSLSAVWTNPTKVFLDMEKLRSLAAEIARNEFIVPSWREPVFPKEDSEAFIDFVGVGNSINFAFTDFATYQSFSVGYRGANWRGAFAMWACLARAIETTPEFLSGRYLANLSLPVVREIFRGDTVIPLVEERWRVLQEVGTVLEQQYGGYFHNLFESARFSALGGDGIVDKLLKDFPSFRDETYHVLTGTVLRFAKRAQLMAMMYHGRAMSSDSLPKLSDPDSLGPIADYSIPRSLHSKGVLRYAPELETKVKARQIIEKDTVEEQEIRAQAIHAQVLLLHELRGQFRLTVSTLSLDYKLWMLGRTAAEPHHLTKTLAY